jgi:hypothetical protein
MSAIPAISTPSPRTPIWEQALSLVLMFALICLSSWWTLASDVSVIWDANGQFASWFLTIGDFARQGHLVFWDPWTEAGSPSGVEPQWGANSPLVVAASALLPAVERSYRLFVWLNCCWGALGMWMLGRSLGAFPLIRAAAGLALFGSAYVLFHYSQPVFFFPILWAPWILLPFESRLRQHRPWLAPAVAGATAGLAGLMSYPGVFISLWGFLALWLLARAVAPPMPHDAPAPRLARLKSNALSLLIAAAVCALVVCPSYVGMIVDAKGYTARVNALSREDVLNQNQLTPVALSGVLSPAVPYAAKANPNQNPQWLKVDATGMGVYMSLAAIIVILFSLCAFGSNRLLVISVLTIGMIGLMISLSEDLPLRGWLYDFIPFTRYFRHSSLFVSFYSLSICLALLVLAPAAPSASPPKSRLFWTALPFALIGLVLCVVLGHILAEMNAPDGFIHSARLKFTLLWTLGIASALLLCAQSRQLKLAGGVLLVIAVGIDPVLHHPVLKRFMVTAAPERVSLWQNLADRHQPSLDLAAHTGTQRLVRLPVDNEAHNKHLQVKIPVLQAYQTFQNPAYYALIANSTIQNHLASANRFWFSASAPAVPLDQPTLELFLKQAIDTPDGPPMVIHNENAIAPAQAPFPVAHPMGVENLVYLPDRLEFQIQCPSDGWLIVTDRWAPGWSAWVNDAPVEIHKGDFVFRAIPVRPGPNVVLMTYSPPTRIPMLALSWGTLLIVFSCLVYAAPFFRRRPTLAPNEQNSTPPSTLSCAASPP